MKRSSEYINAALSRSEGILLLLVLVLSHRQIFQPERNEQPPERMNGRAHPCIPSTFDELSAGIT
nr:hypothetical protein Q903MT_gene1695 [Picea sitchensis]